MGEWTCISSLEQRVSRFCIKARLQSCRQVIQDAGVILTIQQILDGKQPESPSTAATRPPARIARLLLSRLLSPVSCLLFGSRITDNGSRLTSHLLGFSPNVEKLSRGTPKIKSNDR
jgi:hypothetical protein